MRERIKMSSRRGSAALLAAVLVVAGGCSVDDSTDSTDEGTAEPSGEMTAEPSGEMTTEPSGEMTAEPSGEMTAESSGEMTTESSGEMTAESSAGSGGAEEVATGPGVDDDSINLAMLTDLSGPFAAGATIQVAMTRAYWDDVNANGGVCDRQIELDVQDHGYDPQVAVSQYTNIAADTLAVQQLLGSPMVAALLPQMETDRMYVGGMGWASVVLPADVAQIPGASYSIQGASAVDWLVGNEGIVEGDSIGIVFFEGDYGSDVLAGVAFAAEGLGIEVVEQPVTPADTDLTSQVAALSQAGVKAVVLGGSPGTLASYASAALSSGLDVPIVGANPVFGPSLLDSPAADLLQQRYTSITAVAPYSSTDAGPQAAVDLYTAAGNDAVGWEVPLAHGQALLLHRALDAACTAGDLTREGVVTSMRSLTGVDTDGVFPDGLDYTTIGEPPTRKVFVSTVNPDAAGGLELIEVFEGESALAYSFG